MPSQAHARQEFAILTHVRSGSSLLADLLARNGIGDAQEHLNQRALAKRDRSWDPAQVLAEARARDHGEFFGSKVMVHWLDDLKRHAGAQAASDAQILGRLFAPGFATIHLYRADTVAAAVSLTLAELSGRWHQVGGQAVAHPAGDGLRLPRWRRWSRSSPPAWPGSTRARTGCARCQRRWRPGWPSCATRTWRATWPRSSGAPRPAGWSRRRP